jgi:basic membrane protein A and related proteins
MPPPKRTPSALPNLVGIQFREYQSGFLAGVLAGLMTESNIVGGVYGPDIPPVLKFRNGFENGVKFVNPDAQILRVHIGDFLAAAEGAEAAANFIGEGADVIFGAGGPTGSGAIRYAAEQGVKVIGVDQDEFFTTFGAGETPGAENIISSAVKRVDVGVYQMLQALSAGGIGWPVDSTYVMDAAVEGVGFAPANQADVPEDVTARLNEILGWMSAGNLDTGVDPLSGELLGDASMTEEATPES